MKKKYKIEILYPLEEILPIIGDSDEAQYIYRYLKEIEAVTCILEDQYIDKDYLIDYSKYYARSFNPYPKTTKRLHFFGKYIDKKQFRGLLLRHNESELEELNKSYLGFIIIKPIKNSREKPLIGRTILKPYPRDAGDEKREHIELNHPVSLYGIDLQIKSLPYQMQDSAVGACATIACWVSLYPLRELFDIEIQSPVEITEKSIAHPSLNRNFPSTGLSFYQIKTFFNSVGLETEFVELIPEKLKKQLGRDHRLVEDLIKAYVSYNIPIIACLKLEKEEKKRQGGRRKPKREPDFEQHAVIISGYRHRSGEITELYVHDDRIGPYHRVLPVLPSHLFLQWDNEWLNRYYSPGKKYSAVKLELIIIPLYPKIRMSFLDIYRAYLDFIEEAKKVEIKDPSKKFSYELRLTDVKKYKRFLHRHPFFRRESILLKPFPRFLWIFRVFTNGKLHYDHVYDATLDYPSIKPYERIKFIRRD